MASFGDVVSTVSEGGKGSIFIMMWVGLIFLVVALVLGLFFLSTWYFNFSKF